MDTKFRLSKSQSSNTTVKKCMKKNKKCLSSADFPEKSVKKRGVYVEKTSVLDNKRPETGSIQEETSPIPSGKRDVTKILETTISKKSIASQYKETKTLTATKDTDRRSFRRRNTSYLDNKEENDDTKLKNNRKYTSKYLNNIEKQVTSWKSKIGSRMSSSAVSGVESMLSLESSVREIKRIGNIENKIGGNLNINTLAREVEEGKEFKKTKRVRIHAPITLVGNKDSNLDEKVLYNLFVDVLENTLDSCPMDSTRVNAKKSSSNNFVIDEAVADALNITRKDEEKNNSANTHQELREKQYYEITDDELRHQHEFSKLITKKSSLRTKKPKSGTIDVKFKQNAMKNNISETANTKKQNKKAVISLLKKQLSIDDAKEPKNLYEALKVIADNKKRSFDSVNTKKNMRKSYKSVPDCVFKPPAVLRRQK